MKKKHTRDFLIRNMPLEIYHLLEKAASDHHRSMTQEAIVALSIGLSLHDHQIKKPIPFNWNKKISNEFIEEAIKEGRNDN